VLKAYKWLIIQLSSQTQAALIPYHHLCSMTSVVTTGINITLAKTIRHIPQEA